MTALETGEKNKAGEGVHLQDKKESPGTNSGNAIKPPSANTQEFIATVMEEFLPVTRICLVNPPLVERGNG